MSCALMMATWFLFVLAIPSLFLIDGCGSGPEEGSNPKQNIVCKFDEEAKFKTSRWSIYECDMITVGKLTGFIRTGAHLVEVHLATNHECTADADGRPADRLNSENFKFGFIERRD